MGVVQRIENNQHRGVGGHHVQQIVTQRGFDGGAGGADLRQCVQISAVAEVQHQGVGSHHLQFHPRSTRINERAQRPHSRHTGRIVAVHAQRFGVQLQQAALHGEHLAFAAQP